MVDQRHRSALCVCRSQTDWRALRRVWGSAWERPPSPPSPQSLPLAKALVVGDVGDKMAADLTYAGRRGERSRRHLMSATAPFAPKTLFLECKGRSLNCDGKWGGGSERERESEASRTELSAWVVEPKSWSERLSVRRRNRKRLGVGREANLTGRAHFERIEAVAWMAAVEDPSKMASRGGRGEGGGGV
ncbi:hypothetical protein chiPu_0026700 [Chiloscyllium punctatum]|uniref:Uncharacterized protein n=1 Tax=Chiloscyllium punctatum TaxID=137246 RepID=A0A401TJ43_CHIPU|nr:hypothetical protein [Chiloscyllium punctatum]